jgi:hypothetical protein
MCDLRYSWFMPHLNLVRLFLWNILILGSVYSANHGGWSGNATHPFCEGVRWFCSQKSRRKSEGGWLHESVAILAELCHDCFHPAAVLFFMRCRHWMCDVLTASLDVLMTPKYWTWCRICGINFCLLCWVYNYYCIWLKIWYWDQRRIYI